MREPSEIAALRAHRARIETALRQWELWEFRRLPTAGETRPERPPPVSRQALEELLQHVMASLAEIRASSR
ncbi:MAG TPA: hypothetical protein VGW38_14020 [Chloroflexota bacterium]|nr:hypothetical protein [Chloroflexota bacterium]